MTRMVAALVMSLSVAACAGTPAKAPVRDGAITPARPPAVERGALVLEGLPEIPPALIGRVERLLETRAASVADWAPDGKSLLVATRFADTAQIHQVAMAMGARQQLTFAAEPVSDAVSRPGAKAREFLFLRDSGGNENFQIYRFNQEAGTITRITDGKSRNTSIQWSNDGRWLAYSSNRRNGTDGDIYVASGDDPLTARKLFDAKGLWRGADWSADGRKLLAANAISNMTAHAYLVDVATGEKKQVGAARPDDAYFGIRLAADENSFFAISQSHGDLPVLGRFVMEGGKMTAISRETKWGVEEFDLSLDRTRLAFTVNEAGYSVLKLADPSGNRAPERVAVPKGVITGLRFSPDGKSLAFTLNQPTAPADAYVLSLGTGKVTRWTASETGGIPQSEFADTALISFPTFDKGPDGKTRMLDAFIYRPKDRAGRLPVIIDIHGGPEAQARPVFKSGAQLRLRELGAAVILPNVRGSEGYGISFMNLDNGPLREDSVKDIGALIDWVSTQPDLDPARIIVEGGSYGGYMVLASLTHFPDRLAGGINYFGISNFTTFLKATADYRRDLRRAEYGDERDPAMRAVFDRISPLNNVDRIARPLFTFQGQNDPRVPPGESRQIVDAVRAKGLPAWYVLARNEGHGLAKRTNRLFVEAAAVNFAAQLIGQAPKP